MSAMLEENSEDNGKIKINPYNMNNRFITKQEVIELLQLGDVDNEILHLEYYQLSFIHKSYCKKKDFKQTQELELAERPSGCLKLQPESNERLEFLGDSIISSTVAKYLYDRYPNQDEGFMTKIRTRLVNGEALAKLARIINLQDHIIISRHVEERCNGRNNTRILEDAFESFIGAMFLDFNTISLDQYYDKYSEKNMIFDKMKNHIQNLKKCSKSKKVNTEANHLENLLSQLDSEEQELTEFDCLAGPGFQICQKYIINIIENNIDFTKLILNNNNYKDQLLRYFQQSFQITPKYVEEEVEGPPHQRIFTMSVSGPKGNIIGTGKGKSKKKAEQRASRYALIYYGKISMDDDTESNDSD
jgi:dsRNA-specific ribonuclease